MQELSATGEKVPICESGVIDLQIAGMKAELVACSWPSSSATEGRSQIRTHNSQEQPAAKYIRNSPHKQLSAIHIYQNREERRESEAEAQHPQGPSIHISEDGS